MMQVLPNTKVVIILQYTMHEINTLCTLNLLNITDQLYQ